MVNNIELIVMSFLASVGFSIVFRMEKKLLPLAGLGGVLTRIALILLKSYTGNKLLIMLLAAMVAALYAEIMAIVLKKPSTVLLYPSIIPLIPGDLLYHAIVGLLISDAERVKIYGPACLQSVCGMAIGFVVISTVMHYLRWSKFFKMSKIPRLSYAAAAAAATAKANEAYQAELEKSAEKKKD